ncbi:hypothetical protein ACWDG9_16915 [Streptomyces sp. NPDC001073]
MLGEHEGELTPSRLTTVMQSVACFPALPVAASGRIALDGEAPIWRPTDLVLIIPREQIPAETYSDRSTGFRVGDRVERSIIYSPIHDDPRDKVGVARPVIQRGTVTDVEDGTFTVGWLGCWVNGHTTETAMRLADPVRIERERAMYGFAVGDTVTTGGSYATGVVLEVWNHGDAPMARVYWPGSGWSNYCRYDFAETRGFSPVVPTNRYEITASHCYAHTA